VPEVLALDRLNEREFLALAEDTALHDGPAIAAHFFQHRAPPFVPLYPNRSE
jgi:hypothetical protein